MSQCAATEPKKDSSNARNTENFRVRDEKGPKTHTSRALLAILRIFLGERWRRCRGWMRFFMLNSLIGRTSKTEFVCKSYGQSKLVDQNCRKPEISTGNLSKTRNFTKNGWTRLRTRNFLVLMVTGNSTPEILRKPDIPVATGNANRINTNSS